ncbi:MAG: DUF6445 family protein [Pontixanthobacter sp.]
MSSSPLSLSPTATVVQTCFGEERQPLVIVDNALTDPNAVVEIAARHDYQPIGPFYPGLRAAVSPNIAMPLVARLLPALETDFNLPSAPAYSECYLSLVTTKPVDLTPIQRLPHFDGVEPERLAVLLYLDRGEQSGTAFYRQRTTGFESIDHSRFETYRTTLDQEIQAGGVPAADYIRGDSDQFERIEAVPGHYNRMIIYRGNSLHCAWLPSGFVPTDNPRTGRLTLNLFLFR